MAGKRTTQHYLLEEPTTGLYAVIEGDCARLSYAPHATRFHSAQDALIAAGQAGIAEQPHELVRVDA